MLFAKDGEIFNIEGKKHLVIGGAYSVDKFYRIREGYGWWDDEQPSDEIKSYVEKQCLGKAFDVVLSHTCPLKYTPTEAFLPGLDQSLIDKSTEIWLDKIEENIDYKKWYCGHWHLEKKIDKLAHKYALLLVPLKEEHDELRILINEKKEEERKKKYKDMGY